MARAAAGLPAKTRLAEHLSLGVLTARFPIDDVQEALLSTGRVSERQRDLPAHVMSSNPMRRCFHCRTRSAPTTGRIGYRSARRTCPPRSTRAVHRCSA